VKLSGSTKQNITQILRDWNAGDDNAPERLVPLVYDQLRRLAAEQLRNERQEHTLQATALVHEAYLKLVDQKWCNWQDRLHFARIAARVMRQVLVEHARARNAVKRGGKLQKLYLDETRELCQERNPDLVELDEALNNFAQIYPRESEVVELKFFGGLANDAVAQALNVSTKTVIRDWTFARTWLFRKLTHNVA
jgi:RNA polymerase sigma factor (TIGR02999 family)